jgi:preprotein translocase subunit SecG
MRNVFGFLLALVIIDGLLMSVIVLLQSGKGEGLAAMGGGGGTVADGVMGGRQAATLLTKATWITGGIFLGLLLVLSIMSSQARTPQSVLQQEFRSAPAPLVPGAVDPTVPPTTGTGQPPAGGVPDTTG